MFIKHGSLKLKTQMAGCLIDSLPFVLFSKKRIAYITVIAPWSSQWSP